MQRMKLAAMAAWVAATLLLTGAGALAGAPANGAAPTRQVGAGPSTPLPGYDKVAPGLWEATAAGQEANMLVVLAEQADLSRAGQQPAKAAKSRYVYDALRAVALRTQAPLRAWLDARGASYRAHYLVNMLAVAGDRSLLLALAARPEVSRLVANPVVAGVAPITELPSSPPTGLATRAAPFAAEWGVRYVHAPEVWSRYGVTGQGIIIGNQDTGIAWGHPALQAKYRGWDGAAADHSYNWHDAIGATVGCPDPSTPCDPHDHGTHTVGTALGDDGQGNQIGVAPGSQWIGCRNMDDRGYGRPETYTECFEFLLAPYPNGGDPLTDGKPELGAHIVSNSWGCPPQEGCDRFTLQQVVENVRAAGVLVVASAGNNGSACGSVIYPIGAYDASFSVGAVDSSGALASFSSRGPVTIDGSNRPKPDITAPGVGVRSALPGGGYGSMSGTSMAAPHVAGVAALLWSAAPSLVGDVDATEAILRETARHVSDEFCGSADPQGWPNNRFGWGYVDALAAVEAAPAQVRAVVPSAALACNSLDDTPVAEAQLTLTRPDGTEKTYIAPTGVFSFTTSPGPVVVQASHPLLGVSLPQQVRLLGLQENTLALAAKRCLYLPLMLR